ncbi:hypothetical protein [Flavobacterium sp.]|uniref:hypothetical protein n=1 Tax=Flavobacterium sp. TaxID=239 RepID=UPI0026293323|nr:hypothetical protein [Flavobacterium sp.]
MITTTTTITTEIISVYDFIKDIVIPILAIVITIGIGYIINNSLKDKEEKAKKQLLLIDSYMDYLKARTDDNMYFTLLTKYEILDYINMNYLGYLINPNDLIARKKLNEINEEFYQELKQLGKTHSNWADYTYKFSFLLGKKAYSKEVMSLEKIIEDSRKDSSHKANFNNSILEKIRNSSEILGNLNSGNEYLVDFAITSIENLVIDEYYKYQFQIFDPYNQKIADLINE